MRVFVSGPYGDQNPDHVIEAHVAQADEAAKQLVLAGHVPFCVSPDTPILARDLSWVLAGDVREGDCLLGFDEKRQGQLRRLRESTVLYTGHRRAECYKIILSDGTILVSSLDHLWLAQRTLNGGSGGKLEWMCTSDLYKSVNHLNRTKWPVTLYRITPYAVHDQSYKGGYLAGAFDGEGCLYLGKISRSLSFRQVQNSMLQQVKMWLQEKGYKVSVESYIPQQANRQVSVELRLSGGVDAKLQFLMQFRPIRLLDQWALANIDQLALAHRNGQSHVAIVSVTPIGEAEVTVLTTSTATYIAAGYGSHNCPHKMTHGWEKDKRLWPYNLLLLDQTFLRYWAEAVLRLPGESRGADWEVAQAKKLGLPVYYHLEDVGKPGDDSSEHE